ncbi:MAG: hypothetical protein OXD38_00050 [Aestuariivita sp.]|nr:hypothetical protein [Aestuariivita sp.]
MSEFWAADNYHEVSLAVFRANPSQRLEALKIITMSARHALVRENPQTEHNQNGN